MGCVGPRFLAKIPKALPKLFFQKLGIINLKFVIWNLGFLLSGGRVHKGAPDE